VARCKLIVALDFVNFGDALALAREIADLVGLLKINVHLFTAEGPDAVRKLAALGVGVFLDLKFHDIPNTVAGAVTAAAVLPGVQLLDVHTTGGLDMMRAAAEALAASKPPGPRPKLLGVTILTSMDKKALGLVGISGSPQARVVSLARLAKRAGLDGVVASPHEVRQIRRACGRDFLIVVPGVRPAPAEKTAPRRQDDQARVATPGEAIRAGADYLVVGRPITAAPDPRAAAQAIVQEISSAMNAGAMGAWAMGEAARRRSRR
jgi:orotidine-5'-phosphate decarboxylase